MNLLFSSFMVPVWQNVIAGLILLFPFTWCLKKMLRKSHPRVNINVKIMVSEQKQLHKVYSLENKEKFCKWLRKLKYNYGDIDNLQLNIKYDLQVSGKKTRLEENFILYTNMRLRQQILCGLKFIFNDDFMRRYLMEYGLAIEEFAIKYLEYVLSDKDDIQYRGTTKKYEVFLPNNLKVVYGFDFGAEAEQIFLSAGSQHFIDWIAKIENPDAVKIDIVIRFIYQYLCNNPSKADWPQVMDWVLYPLLWRIGFS